MNFLEIGGKRHSPSQKQINYRLGGETILTGNGLISFICKVLLENNNTNNPMEKWLKNMKYKRLLHMYMLSARFGMYMLITDTDFSHFEVII